MTALKALDAERKSVLDPTFWLEKHGDYLYRFALSNIYEQSVAEDLVQETLLAALKAHQNFADNSTERTWLVGILKHKIADYFRRISREISLDETFETDDIFGNESFGLDGHWKSDKTPQVWKADPLELLEQKEFREMLENCLTKLPEKLATAFILCEINGFTSVEICQKLNISKENLYVILHRARMRLRQLIEDDWFNPK